MKILSLLVIASFLLSTANATSFEFRRGDLIFQTSQTPQSKVIQRATGSVFSHVGIVEVAADGRKSVIEASSTVREIDIETWIGNGLGGKFAVYRAQDMTDAQAANFVGAARRYIGRRYDIFFTGHNQEIYCSELVDYAARDIGLEFGQYQKFGTLDVRNEVVMTLVRERWQGHPLCREAETFEKCFPLIEDDLMVTPVSLTYDAKLKKVFSNY